MVDLIQNVDAGGNSYGGTISGDHVDFIKKGAETLTVEGSFTGNDSMLSSTEGNIVLNGTATASLRWSSPGETSRWAAGMTAPPA